MTSGLGTSSAPVIAPRPVNQPHEPIRDAPIGFVATLLLALALRAVVLAVGWYSIHAAGPDDAPDFNRAHPWIAWDARHYYDIAQLGYPQDRFGSGHTTADAFRLIAYFPLLPVCARALCLVLPLGVALVVISNVCAVAGLILLYDWARRLTSAKTATIAVLLVAAFPGAVAFAAGMTEGPFLLLVAAALWLLQRRRFWWAGLIAGLATALRPTGVALAITLLLYAWTCSRELALPHRLRRLVFLGALSFSGVISYELFLWQRYHTSTAYFQAQGDWTHTERARRVDDAARGVERYSWQFFWQRILTPQAWNRGLALIILLVTVFGFVKPMGIPRVLFLLPLLIFMMTALPGGGLRISSLPRYESASIPIFLLTAVWLSKPRRVHVLATILLLFFAAQVYYALLFPREIWVG
jgi:hypothetical protein